MCSLGTLVDRILPYYSFVRRKNIIGSRVRKARKESKITQMELAARLQLLGIIIDRSGIAKLESGRRPASDIEAAAIAKVLDVPIPWLFEESNNLLDPLGTQ
jgi:transcriptional regulator with XRE-family HTH domain